VKVFEFFVLLIVEICALVALSQVSLVTDLVTASGYSPDEVWAGIASVTLVFDALVLALGVR